MKLKRYDDFINENVNDKHALLDILREWGVFNPLEFMKYLEEIGYTIIELDPVGTNESIRIFDDVNKIFEDDDEHNFGWDDIPEEDINGDKLKNFLRRKGVKEYAIDGFFSSLYSDLGYVIVKDDEWTDTNSDFVPENENKLIMEYSDYNKPEGIDLLKDKINKKINPSLVQHIQKLGRYMQNAVYYGGRARLYPGSVDEKEQYDSIVQYVYFMKKTLKGIHDLEKKIKSIKKKRKLTDEETEWFERHINWVIDDGYRNYPWKFTGQLSKFDQEELDIVAVDFDKLVDRYHGKKIYPKRNEKV